MATSHRNLTPARAPVNVWEQPGWGKALDGIDRDRALCLISSAAVAAYGFRRRGLLGGALAAVGASFAARAIAGHNDMAQARIWLERALDACGWASRRDRVEDDSDASFPASDAPSWTPTAGATTRDERARPRDVH
jgi:hypothetical protein